MTRYLLTSLFAATLTGCATVPDAPSTPSAPVTVGIIALNDFHGALEPPRTAVQAPDGKGGTVAVPAGGAAWLASAVDSIRAKYPNNAVVAAGDLISASQLTSSIYLDEPAIGVMNRIGLDFNAVGNHEFDRGRDELLRMQNGGCEQHTAREPCQVEQFGGAQFSFLAASTFTEDGSTLFPATAMKSFGSGNAQVNVGFVGLTLKETPSLVSPGGIKGLTFGDEAEAVNAALPRLKAQGADAVVVLIHQGGKTSGTPNPNGCEALTGDILPILARLDPQVDLVVTGHSHWPYVCDYGMIDPARPFLLTSAGMNGGLITDIALTIDPAAGKVVSKQAKNMIVQSTAFISSRGEVPNTDLYPRFDPRADVAEYVGLYTKAAAEFSGRIVGRISAAAAKPGGALSNTGGTLGNLIADAQLHSTRIHGAEIAFMNPFGIRAPLEPGADGSLTFSQLYAVQPFGNTMVTQSMTGTQIKALLEQGLDGEGPNQLLAPSSGFTYRYDPARPLGDRIFDISFNGQPLDPARDYRVAVNGFLAWGGDGYTALLAQRDATMGVSDIEALEAWVKSAPVLQVSSEVRAVGPGQ